MTVASAVVSSAAAVVVSIEAVAVVSVGTLVDTLVVPSVGSSVVLVVSLHDL